MDLLLPGFDQELYYTEPQEFISDISFVGHLSNPWSSQEDNRIIFSSSDRLITFEQARKHLEQKIETEDIAGYIEEDYINLALSFIPKNIREQISLSPTVKYDLACRTLRMTSRHKMLSMACANGVSRRFFGTSGWNNWSQYKPYYQGMLTDPAKLRKVYQTSRINLHDGAGSGVGLHFRTMDCMASGGLLFYLESVEDSRPGGMHSVFTPGKHYVSVNKANFANKVKFYLNHANEHKEMCVAANKEVMQNHQWKFRIQKIVEDLQKL
ncbi:MAG: glycosyltransferase family 1 protein [Magnetococcales bacterium]|nr:glycosyltransferase family 1 protein [Magnetococcales bacterium]